jgi:hypothetical protein
VRPPEGYFFLKAIPKEVCGLHPVKGHPFRHRCAIVLIGHLNKASGVQSDYRTLGSVDIAAAVRSILFVEKVKKEKSQDIRVVY